MNRFSRSWALIKASARVLAADKELLVFPILSSIATLIVTLTFAVPLLLSGGLSSVSQNRFPAIYYLVLFLFYIVQYFVIFFANTALVGAATIRLKGGDPTVGDGFRIAFSHFGPILGYSVIAATVGMLLRMVSERSRGLGRILISLIGFAWNVATFLVVPILAVEGIGPIQAIQRSVALLKKTWGEQIIGNFGVGVIFGLIIFGLILISLPIFYLLITAKLIMGVVALVVILVLLFILIGLVQSALNGIYTAAIYQFAVDERTVFFDESMIRDAFVERR
ncbi:hypothetical protein LARV_02956 [Longilinea arvoryzae]|uniref:Glycerophosphoryl diester phosphodiesterase membrane domain-containing protein n=1 Tax=Longilinea arvoryzae TaxID=360412 RepID=A0A0S7BKU6_9CHLR|nr:DUF6159 family protein [Longilinea arvoryzae]GAP15174.1 hypothetical protein LARV_02956 [Longilinea arvoryzae]